jgi:hypothetical protein
VVGQWYLRAPAGEVQSSIDVEPAWSMSSGGAKIVVAVIDTGVRYDHADLKRVVDGGSLLPGYDMISDLATASDGNGRDADAADPGDWLTLEEVTQENSPYYGCGAAAEDSSWHGTQTSALVATLTGNGIGIASVARNMRVYPCVCSARRLRLGHYRRDALGGGSQRSRGSSKRECRARAQSEPRRRRNVQQRVPRRSGGHQRGGRGRRRRGRQQHRAYGGRSRQLPRCHRRGRAAPCRHQGRLLRSRSRHRDQRAGRQLHQHRSGRPLSVSDRHGYNSGLTTPIVDGAGGSIYTDSFNASLGTSSRRRSLRAPSRHRFRSTSLTPTQVRERLRNTARPFPTTGGDNGDGTPVPQCRTPQPIGRTQFDQLQCYCTASTCGAGMLDAGSAVHAATRIFLTVVRTGSGIVSSAPAGIDCGVDCSAYFTPGIAVSLNAVPRPDAPGGRISVVGGDCADAGNTPACVLTIAADRNVTATFVYVGDGSDYSRASVQKVYVAYYGRPADPAGQGFWALRMDAAGGSLNAIVGAFGTSAEFDGRYGGLSYSALVTTIYQQTLGRAPDAAGLAYYVGELQAGRRTLQSITLDVLNGATTAPDATVVANKLDVAAYYTAKVAGGCPYGTEQDGVATNADVTALSASVTAAKAAIDAWCSL